MDPEDHGVLRLLLDQRQLVGVQDRKIGDHARGLHALVVAALEPHFPVVLVRVDLQRIHAQPLGQRRHRANVADGSERERGVRLQMNVGVRLNVLVERVGPARIVQALTRLHRVGRVEDVHHVEELLAEVPGRLAGLNPRCIRQRTRAAEEPCNSPSADGRLWPCPSHPQLRCWRWARWHLPG